MLKYKECVNLAAADVGLFHGCAWITWIQNLQIKQRQSTLNKKLSYLQRERASNVALSYGAKGISIC